jgi:Cd2+/Zn2+-exporting ATPase
VDRGPGDSVAGGTINESGSLTVRVQRVGDESAHGKVLRLIQGAESHRAPILRAAESYARWFTPGVLSLAAVVWAATGDAQRAVTMLIVGCPCAFVLATPTAIVAAMSRAAREGLLIKGGRYVEGCARVAAIAFDKTGTLTKGECRVVDVIAVSGSSPGELLAAAARLEAAADHPLARAIQARASAEGVAVSQSLAILREAGLGITGRSAEGGDAWHLGNARFMARHGVDVERLQQRAETARAQGLSVVYVARGSEAKGLLSIEDEVRPEARGVISELRADGLRDVQILSGDATPVVLAVAARVGVEPGNVYAELLPEQKYERVLALEREHGRLCYVGDGANDGPALSVATAGISLGSRHDTVALETAAVVLMGNSLSALPFLFRLSRATTRTINLNLILFGLVFNAAMLALSSAGFLTPIYGALAHNVGSVSVVLNSARLLLFERARGRATSPQFP